MRPYTPHEFMNTPHVIMTSDQVWDATYADNYVDPCDPSFVDNTLNAFHFLPHDKYDLFGEYTAYSASNLDANGSVDFDEYLASNLFLTLASNLTIWKPMVLLILTSSPPMKY